MNQITVKKIAVTTGLFLGAFTLSVLAQGAWAPADCAAPNCNTWAPINVSPFAQIKTGSLTISGAPANANGSALTVDGITRSLGLLVEGQSTTDSLNVVSSLKATIPGSANTNFVLTNTGAGVAEWKSPSAGGVTLSKVEFIPLVMVRNPSSNETRTKDTTETYLFCAMSRIDAEMSRVNSNQGSGYCQISKNADGKWKMTGFTTANNPDFTCEMVCFK